METLVDKALWMLQHKVFDKSFLENLVNRHYPIVSVDRVSCLESSRPIYEFLFPGFENSGPESFDVRRLEPFFVHGQTGKGLISLQKVFDELQRNGLLVCCLNSRELLAIKKRGFVFFQEHYKEKYLFAWKSVVRFERNGPLYVPVLWAEAKKLIQDFEEINARREVDANCCTMYHKKQ